MKSFHGFVIVGGKIEPIARLLLYLIIKMKENLYKKPYQKWKTAVKIFEKHQNVLTGTPKKRQISFQKFFGEYVLFLTPFLLLKRGGGQKF